MDFVFILQASVLAMQTLALTEWVAKIPSALLRVVVPHLVFLFFFVNFELRFF
jgi:hypothetical protein